jgi:superfamily I DNA/RNA helicase
LAETPVDLVLDANAVTDDARLLKAVLRSFAYWGKATATGTDADRGVATLIDMVAHDLRVQDLLSAKVDEADRRILDLSKHQLRVLDYMRRNPRVAVAGCAGSGKTLLAAEKAQRLAKSGFRTLLTCFNRPLADHLREALGDQDGLIVQNFHSLCATLAQEARIALDWPIRPADEPGFYERVLPNTLLKVTERLGPTFDALVIDEGQDFAPTWWEALSFLLEDPDRGIMYVFFDDNQSLYRRPGGLPSDLVNLELHENWRNTRPIHELVSKFYTGDPLIGMGPDGPPVDTTYVESPGLLRAALGRVLHRLCVDNKLLPEDIVIHLDAAAVVGPVGAFVVELSPSRPNQVKVSSIHRFKGLDAKVVVLIDVDAHRPDYGELMYVGCSRARSYLAVVRERNHAGTVDRGS